MKSFEHIPLQQLAKLHHEMPDVFPVFGKICRVKGVPVGEIIGYSDEYGRRIHIEQSNQKVYH